MAVQPAYSQISQGGYPFSFNGLIKDPIPTLVLPGIDKNALLAEDEAEQQQDHPRAPRFATALAVDISPNNSGTWTTLDTGDRVWRVQINSRGAESLSFIFDDFFLPESTTLYIYSKNKRAVLGAFTSENNKLYGRFSTEPLPGPIAILEYYEPNWVSGNVHLHIEEVAHAYRNVFRMMRGEGQDNESGFDDSASCNININCSEGTDWQDEKHAIAMVLLDDLTRWCSGFLINNTDEDNTNYFQTAHHCADVNNNLILTSGEISDAEDWIFYFNYESPACSPSTEPGTYQTISGATFRAGFWHSDVLLMELSSMTPYAYPYYLGWSRSTTAPDNIVGIHHPKGDVKKISSDGLAPTAFDAFDTGDYTHWRVLNWDEGTTEGGSSGSPLFDTNNRVIGQVHKRTNQNPVCGGNKGTDYGAFHWSWDEGTTSSERLKDWLDPADDDPTTLDGQYGIIPPEPPSSFSITNPTSTGLPPQMSWTASPSQNVDYYEVYRCPSYYRNCFSYGGTIGTTSGTSYTDMTVEIVAQAEAWDKFAYRVRAVSDDAVESAYTNWSSVWGDPVSKRGQDDVMPAQFSLNQNYPNPFNPLTVITYFLPEEAQVRLIVYNEAAREIMTLVDEVRSAGEHRVSFDARYLSSGVYFYQLRAGSKYASKRMTLIR